jgi:hypothetical protein
MNPAEVERGAVSTPSTDLRCEQLFVNRVSDWAMTTSLLPYFNFSTNEYFKQTFCSTVDRSQNK